MEKLISFDELLGVINKKIAAKENDSYSYLIASQGVEKMARKIGEEAVEVLIASFVDEKKNDKKSREELVGEICDLFFHTLILMGSKGIKMEEILQELTKRNNKKK